MPYYNVKFMKPHEPKKAIRNATVSAVNDDDAKVKAENYLEFIRKDEGYSTEILSIDLILSGR
jgi:hypothetical protein